MEPDTSTENRVTRVEHALAELAEAQVRTQQHLDQSSHNLDRLSDETRALRDDLWEFKNEIRSFKGDADRLVREIKASGERFERESRKQWGELANRMGTLVEDLVAPGIPEILKRLFGLKELDVAAPRVWRRHRTKEGHSREFDYVAMAGDVLLVNETKSTLRPDDIPAFLQVLSEVRDYFPEAEGRSVIGSLATCSVDPSLVVAGERQGWLSSPWCAPG